MSKIEDRDESFAIPEDELFVEYNPVSRMAMVSLVLGIASVFALAQPFLVLIPLASFVVSVLALRAIARPDSKLTGRWMAQAGMVSALFFGAWGQSQHLTYRQLICNQAREHAEYWLELVGDQHLYEAYELHQPDRIRQLPDTDLKAKFGEPPRMTAVPEPYPREDEEFVRRFNEFWAVPLHRKLAIYGREGKFHFEKFGEVYPDWDPSQQMWSDWAKLYYRLTYEEDGVQREIPIWIYMCRERLTVGEPANHWYVFEVVQMDE